ncbi:MAG: N-acyl homoserine lactonase family protein [Candidatus Korobacteraceae bacterium]|jgi:glyoxylase-like metal-dependent hydrolase (beta-lactamase superfamily II)
MRIVPLHVGDILRDKSSFTCLRNQGLKVELPVICWLIETNEAKVIVDTGTNAPHETAEHHKPLTRTREQEPAFLMDSLGVNVADIDLVILTHLHWDHCYNNHLFPNAEFLVQREELRYAIAPLPLHAHAYDLPPIVGTKYKVIDGDKKLGNGISVVCTPGHTPGFQSVLVESPNKRILIASDTIPLFENWCQDPPLPSGVFNNLEKYYSTFDKISRLETDLVLPGHDRKVFDQPEYVL